MNRDGCGRQNCDDSKNNDDDDYLRLRVLMLLILVKLYDALVFSLVSSADDGPPSFTSIAVSVNLRDNR